MTNPTETASRQTDVVDATSAPRPRRAATTWSIAIIVVLSALAVFAGRGPVDPESADQSIGRFAVQHLDAGDSYYVAMEKTLTTVNGPARTGRAFRAPLIFEVWHILPGEDAVWLAFVVLVAGAAIATARTSDCPLVAPFILGYLLRNARLDQHFLVEIWTGPILLLAVAAWRRAWYKTAAALAVVASFVRELAVLLAIGGLWSRRRDPAPWIVAILTIVIGVGAHFTYASQFTSPDGNEAALFGTGSVEKVLATVGAGFSHGEVVGLVIWALACWRLTQDRDLARFLGPLVAFPLIGLQVGRIYWGYLCVPVLLLLAGEAIGSAVPRVRSRQQRDPVALPVPVA